MKNGIRFTLKPKQRPKLAQKIGKILGTAPHYERVPSCAYDIAGYRLDKEGVLHIPEGVAVEMAEHLIRQLRERGFQDDAEFTEEVPMQQDKLTIAVPRACLTDTALDNLQKIITNKQTLFQKAFQTDSTEVEITEEKINFAWFLYTEDGDEIAAYTQFITGLCDMAKDAKRVSSKPTETDNDKYGNRSTRFHQFLTEDTGLPTLDHQLQQTIALMKASDTWEEFDKLFRKAMGEPVQLELSLKNE